MTINVTREQAVDFLHILNSFRSFIPPVMYQALNGHPVLMNLMTIKPTPPKTPDLKMPVPPKAKKEPLKADA